MPSVGRLLRSADFQRLLAVPPRWRSAHFCVHHVNACPSVARGGTAHRLTTELSTGPAHDWAQPVDDSPGGVWAGAVVPKRHARRAVTRNMLKRQIRAALERRAAALRPGLWLVRLRAPWSRELFRSADSAALREQVRDELDRLLAQVTAPAAPERGAA